MSLIFNHTIIRKRATVVKDRYQNDVAGPTASTPLPGWAVDAGDTSQDIEGRQGSVVSYTIRTPDFDVDVKSSDQIELFGVEYEVYGEVLRQPGPTHRTSHTIVRLYRAEG